MPQSVQGSTRRPIWLVSLLIALTLGVAVGGVLPVRSTEEPALVPPPSMEQPFAPSASVPEAAIAPFPGPELEPGREYLPLGALESAAGVARPELPDAPTEPVAAPEGATTPDSVEATAAPAPPAPPPNPVRRLSLAEARAIPLLVVRRGERVAFHETETGRSVRPVGSIEGEWALPGRCASPFRLDLAQPVERAGQVRGIGRDREASAWSVGVAFPAHACAEATTRWSAARPPSEEERAQLGRVVEGDLVSVVRPPRGAAWLLVRAGSTMRALVVPAAPSLGEAAWSYEARSAGADLRLAGVYRGDGWEGWVVELHGEEPIRVLRLTSPDGAVWTADAPVEMRR